MIILRVHYNLTSKHHVVAEVAFWQQNRLHVHLTDVEFLSFIDIIQNSNIQYSSGCITFAYTLYW